MQRPQDTINREIIKSGKSLSGKRWFRVPMALLLVLGGCLLIYHGQTDGKVMVTAAGFVFIVCAALTCFVVRKAEKTISAVQDNIDEIVRMVDEKEDKATGGS